MFTPTDLSSELSQAMDSLPESIMLKIFSFLTPREMFRLHIICKKWRELLQDFSLWTNISITYDNHLASIVTDEMISSWLVRWGSHIRSLQLRYCRKLSNFVCQLISMHCPHVEMIDLQGCIGIGDYGVAQIAENCSSLQKVNIFMTGVSQVGCSELVKNIPGISAIKLPSKGNCYQSLDAICSHCNNLESLILNDVIPFDEKEPVVNDSAIMKVAETFSMIRKISLNWCWYITDACMEAIAENCKNLDHLVVRESHQISDEGLIQIVRLCPKLKKLQLGRLYGVTDRLADGFANKQNSLIRLKLIDTAITDKGVSKILENSPEMQGLYIGEYCFNANKICGDLTISCAKYCKNLQDLVVVSCKSIDDQMLIEIAKNLPRLKTLFLSSCEDVTEASLNVMIDNCKQLRELRICKCLKLDDIMLDRIADSFLALNTMEIYGCSMVTSEGVRLFLRKKPNCYLRI